MTDRDIEPLPDDVLALVDRAGSIPSAPRGAKDRVRAGLAAALGPPTGGGGGGRTGGGGSDAARTLPHAHASSVVKRLLPLVVSFVTGAGVGVVGTRTTSRTPEVRVVYLERPATGSPPSSSPDASPAPTAASVTTPELPSPVASTRAPSASTRDDLVAERALLDTARSALEAEDGASALDTLAQHERRFARGTLVQEREAMAVRALLLLGRRSEARERVNRFRARFPDSVMLETLESAVAASPSP
jgi:hypothetical protein